MGIWSSFSEGVYAVRWPVLTAYWAVMAFLCVHGAHRYWLTWTYYRTRTRRPRAHKRFTTLPRVTVQLPMYNELHVAERVITAACAMDWPADKLQVQVLDDSTDPAAIAVVQRVCQQMRQAGHDVELLHRTDRTGFKAGALEAGLASATGEYLAIFDADFVPPRRFLKRTIHHFTDASVGMVQACWDHLNRDDSLLTRAQAVFLDAHFQIEHAARNRSGRWMNFNGTAGVWRREAITTAGGWQHDTLTEDMDLSYRSQLAGWRCVFLQRVLCPAELPPDTRSFKSQQRRWAKGSVQTGRKLLGQIWRSSASMARKIEATFHVTSPLVYLAMVALLLLLGPVAMVYNASRWSGWMQALSVGAVPIFLATFSGGTFYIAGQRERGGG